MIGNDLVDLNQAKLDSNWERSGYLDKIFSLDEQNFILKSQNSNEVVWRLWSMKEAAYKIHNRKTGIRIFAPRKIVCPIVSFDDFMNGKVLIDDSVYYTKTQINKEFIHTIAKTSKVSFEQIQTKIYDFPYPKYYRKTNPDCISHHGRYLSLVYIL